MQVAIETFGQPDKGGTTNLIRLTNESGAHIALIPVGARVVELHVPDRDGTLGDVVLGFTSIHDYLKLDTYAGSIAGRYANRIAGAAFDIDDERHLVEANEGRNHVHGGFDGLDRQTWNYHLDEATGTITFTHISPDGHGGYPGALTTEVAYRWFDERNRLQIDFLATTTRPTVVNLVHHGYWNMGGHDSGNVYDQLLEIAASSYTPVDEELLAIGEIAPVEDTPFDFRTAHRIGDLIGDLPSIGGAGRLEDGAAGGYDHNWVLDGTRGELHRAAQLTDLGSGRELTLSTTEAGVQMYTAGYMQGFPGKAGATYDAGAGITLETQTFPCSPNLPNFPSAELRPAETYRHTMVMDFMTTVIAGLILN